VGPGQGVWGTEVPQWGPGATLPQKLKQNVKLEYNF